ncbi:MAG: EAF7 family protein, partial [Cytophagales bacterium]|nr:EAF7 family protein [Cytophagales bacterium]
MIAISEHLRKHGYDPDVYKHTQIPSIWDKLRSFYNLDLIDERENGMIDDDRGWKEFVLPYEDFHDNMMRRCLRGHYDEENGAISLTDVAMETDDDSEGSGAAVAAGAESLSTARADKSHHHNSKRMLGTERETRKRRRAATRGA